MSLDNYTKLEKVGEGVSCSLYSNYALHSKDGVLVPGPKRGRSLLRKRISRPTPLSPLSYSLPCADSLCSYRDVRCSVQSSRRELW